MKNLFKVLGIVALVAIIGFSMAACGDGGGGGGDDLSLYISSIHTSGNNYEVEFKITSDALKNTETTGYVLTIDGDSVTIDSGGSGTLNGTMHKSLYFTIDPPLTVGTKYAVEVTYSGTAVAKGTVPLQASKYN